MMLTTCLKNVRLRSGLAPMSRNQPEVVRGRFTVPASHFGQAIRMFVQADLDLEDGVLVGGVGDRV